MPNTPPNNPVLSTPVDQSYLFGTILTFVFTVPSDIDDNKLVFNLELDINNPINSSSSYYKTCQSRFNNGTTNGKWEVQDGVGTYVTLPTGGIDSSYYGRTAKVTIKKQLTTQFPNIETIWYWRIGASDLLAGCQVFNRVVFAQGVFCSG